MSNVLRVSNQFITHNHYPMSRPFNYLSFALKTFRNFSILGAMTYRQ